MEYKTSIESNEINIDPIGKVYLSEICQVCGEENAKYAYGVQSCASCKIFFRRNAKLDLNKIQCLLNEECNVTIKNRHTCRYCRYKKCLSIGMNKDLLRAPHGAQGGKKNQFKLLNKKKKSSIEFIYTNDLLNNDRSLLTIDQWSLLSNINNYYDSKTPIQYIRYSIENQSKFPLKMRLKMSNNYVMDFLHSMYSFSESFINIIPEYLSLNMFDRLNLIKRNILNLGGYNCQFMMSQTNMVVDSAYSNSLFSTYGSYLFNGTCRIVQDFDMDHILNKLFLIVMAFSTCSDAVISPYNTFYQRSNYDLLKNLIEINNQLINTINLFKIQNKYIEMMFKYMIYKYGYYEAALRFSNLMKNFLYQGILSSSALNVSKHDHMLQTIIHETEKLSLTND